MAQEAIGPPPEETLSLWKREQALLKARVVDQDTEAWQRDPAFAGLQRVGGVDVSFVKGDSVRACASLVVLSYPELEVLYEDSRLVHLTAPYLPGFLAFREAPFLADAVRRLREEQPSLVPQVLLVDGNGVLHPRGFGVACHLGVLTDLPCVGVAKKLLQVDGLEKDALHRDQIRLLRAGGDSFPLTGRSGAVLGRALTPSRPGPAEPRWQPQAALRLCGPQDEPGGGRAPDPQLLPVPGPRARAPGRHPLPRIHPQDPGPPPAPHPRAGEHQQGSEARERPGRSLGGGQDPRGPQPRPQDTHGSPRTGRPGAVGPEPGRSPPRAGESRPPRALASAVPARRLVSVGRDWPSSWRSARSRGCAVPVRPRSGLEAGTAW